MLVKRLFMIGVISPLLIRMDDMIADLFTRAVTREKFAKFRTWMLNQDHGPNTIGALSAKGRKIWKQLRSV